MPVDKAARRRGILLVLVATVLWSLAGFYTRLLAHLDLWTLLCGRAFFGGLCISVWAVVEWRRGSLGPRFGLGPAAPFIILLSATAISSYVAAVKTTTVADVLVIYATMPFVAAALAFVITGERASRRTIIAAAIAMIGVAVMVAGGIGAGRWLGQALSMLMTLAFGLMVVLQRRRPGMSMTSINAIAAFVSSAFAFHFSPLPPLGAYELVVLFLFGLTTICVAFVTFMEGAKHIPAAEAGLISMLDVVIGPLWVLIGFGEQPGLSAIIGGVIVVAAVIWRVAPELARTREPVDVIA
jgi:drug/metabolite transporter (DMT)-like permease